MEFPKVTVVDQNVQFHNRYLLIDAATGAEFGPFFLSPAFGEIYQSGTEINAAYLQRFEDYLAGMNAVLGDFGLRLESIEERTGAAEAKVTALESVLSTLAPKVNAVLTNPKANTLPVADNSTGVATTAFTNNKLNDLMAAYKG